MNERTSRQLGNVVGVATIAALLWLIWGWWSFSGLYRLIAHLQLSVFGSFGAISTFALGVALMGGIVTAAFQPLIRNQRQAGQIQRRSPAVAKAMAERAMTKVALGGGAIALVVTLAAGALLYRDAQRISVFGELNLSQPESLPPPGAGRIRLIGFTRPDLLINVESKQIPGVALTSTAYMAIVGPDWRPGKPVPVVVQGSPGLGLPSVTRATAETGERIPFDLPSGFVRSFSSGFADDLLAERGAPVDRHTLFLDTRPDAERDVLLPVVILGGLVAALGIAGGLYARHSLNSATANPQSPLAPTVPPLTSNVMYRSLRLRIREVNQGASGGSYVCIFEATVKLRPSSSVTVTISSVEPADPPSDLVEEAKNAIREGAEDALAPQSLGASIDVTSLVIQEIDFKAWRFKAYTTRELRRLMGGPDPAS